MEAPNWRTKNETGMSFVFCKITQAVQALIPFAAKGGNWKLETGNWKSETGKSEIRNQKWEMIWGSGGIEFLRKYVDLPVGRLVI